MKHTHRSIQTRIDAIIVADGALINAVNGTLKILLQIRISWLIVLSWMVDSIVSNHRVVAHFLHWSQPAHATQYHGLLFLRYISYAKFGNHQSYTASDWFRAPFVWLQMMVTRIAPLRSIIRSSIMQACPHSPETSQFFRRGLFILESVIYI